MRIWKRLAPLNKGAGKPEIDTVKRISAHAVENILQLFSKWPLRHVIKQNCPKRQTHYRRTNVTGLCVTDTELLGRCISPCLVTLQIYISKSSNVFLEILSWALTHKRTDIGKVQLWSFALRTIIGGKSGFNKSLKGSEKTRNFITST